MYKIENYFYTFFNFIYMFAIDLVSHALPTIKTSDSGDEVLNLMQIYHIRHLPIVNHEQLLGVLSEEDILANDSTEDIGSYRLSFLRPFVYGHDHVFEVMNKIGLYKLTLIPVVDAEERYIGSITLEEIVKYFSSQYNFSSQGSILLLESQKRDFSLSEVARIAESESAQILSFYLHEKPMNSIVTATIKVDKQDIGGLKSSLERFGYTVSATFAHIDYVDGIKERYDSLMNYLNV
jgi:CBS domain-containing protein